MRIAGEEDALARGAVNVMVKPEGVGLTCDVALGFRDSGMPSGVWGCPDAEEMCVVAGGYGYLAGLSAGAVTMLGMKPVVEVMEAEHEGLLLFVGFHSVMAWGRGEWHGRRGGCHGRG